MADQQTSELAQALQDITQKAQLLVHEEIELAKAEMTEKVTKLIKGAIFGIVAGVFAVFALIYLLHALSWGIWDVIGNESNFWLGFLITGVLILLLGGIAGVIAMRLIKKGSPPTPQLAIEEAQLIKGTLTASPASRTVGSGRHAPRGGGGRALMAATRTPEEIRRSIEANRAELGLAVDRLRAEVAELADWRKQINKRRKEFLIGAAVAGFVIGGGIAALGSLVRGGDDY